jgi:outer membrane immunogenic protein
MMKGLIAAALAAGLGFSGAARAADVYAAGGMKDVVVEAPANWTGGYLGISGGGAFSSPKFSDSDSDVCFDYATCSDQQGVGGLFGGTLGYNWQFRNFVIGVEGDISWAGLNAKTKDEILSGSNYYMESNIEAIATVRLRAGYAIGSSLFYLTGGAAFVEAQHKAISESSPCGVPDSACSENWQTGVVIGAGYEAMLTDHVTFKAEYLHVAMPNDALINPDGGNGYIYGFTDNIDIVRIGVNYKFGGCCAYTPLK